MKSVDTTTFGYRSKSSLAGDQALLQLPDRGRQHQLRVNAELRGQLPLPLLGERRAAQHRQAGRVALLKQLGRDQAGLHGLADADVVGDQQPHRVLAQRHQQRDELIGARLDGKPGQGAERARRRAEPDPHRGAQQAGRRSRACVRRVRCRERRGTHVLQLREHPGHLVVTAAQGAQHEEVRRLRLRQHHPVPAAGGHQRAHLERCSHSVPFSPPKTLGYRSTTCCQACASASGLMSMTVQLASRRSSCASRLASSKKTAAPRRPCR